MFGFIFNSCQSNPKRNHFCCYKNTSRCNLNSPGDSAPASFEKNILLLDRYIPSLTKCLIFIPIQKLNSNVNRVSYFCMDKQIHFPFDWYKIKLKITFLVCFYFLFVKIKETQCIRISLCNMLYLTVI